MQSALEESQLNEKQLKDKLEVQTETLKNKMEELRALNEPSHTSMTSEMLEVQMKIMELESIKVRRVTANTNMLTILCFLFRTALDIQ